MTRYELINYTDVWKDEEGNWAVNDLCLEFDDLYIADDASDKDILNYLKQVGFLATSDMRKLVVEDLGDHMIEIYQRKEMIPLCKLQEAFVLN